MHSTSYSDQRAHKPVGNSLAKQNQVLRAYYPNIYTVPISVKTKLPYDMAEISVAVSPVGKEISLGMEHTDKVYWGEAWP